MGAATSITESIDQTQENNRWISDNMKSLRENYGSEYVAVKDSEVIEHASSDDEIIQRLEEKDVDFSMVTITFIYESGKKILR